MKQTFNYFIIITVFFLHFLSIKVFSQTEDSCKVYQYFEVDQLPKFNYQNKNLSEYIWNKVTWPKNLDVEGEVIVSFVINQYGKVENVAIIKSLCPICDESVKKIFEDLPNFEAGKVNSKPIKVRMFFPIKFVLK